jgi:ligand-binding sensor domain-containing protein
VRLNRARALGAALLLVVSVAAEGAQIAVRRYTVEDGLANSFVTVIYQDSRGYLWLGTRDGLSRFDGERFVNYGAAAGLPTGNVRAVVEDSGQRLWVATWEGGLSRLIDEPGDRPAQNPRHRFVNYKLPGPREANAISALVADLDGSLLALTYGGLFRVRLAGDRLDAQRIADVNHRGGVLRAFVDRRGRRWFMTDREILLMDGGQVRRFVEPVGIGEAWIVGIAESQAGRILAANIHHLFEFTGDAGPSAWRRIDLAMAPREEFRSLVVDARNQLWAGTTRGLFKGGADEVTGPGRVATLDVTVETLFEDRRRNLWIGTDSAGAWLIPRTALLERFENSGSGRRPHLRRHRQGHRRHRRRPRRSAADAARRDARRSGPARAARSAWHVVDWRQARHLAHSRSAASRQTGSRRSARPVDDEHGHWRDDL